jgi:hypothetical protein
METSPQGPNLEDEAATFGHLPPLFFMTVTVFNMGRLVTGMSPHFCILASLISFFILFLLSIFICIISMHNLILC